MAKIRKRGNAYQIDYFDPNGNRVRQSFKKKKDAEAELGKRVSLKAEGRYLDVKKDYKTTLGELVEKYRENYQHQRGFLNSKDYCLEEFKEYFGENTRLANIRYVDLETYRNHLRERPTKHGGLRAIGSINRQMSNLRHLFSKALEWEMVEQNPFAKGKSLTTKESSRRLRYLSEDEIIRLLDNCVNEHIRDIVKAALNTGMRRGELLSLKWEQITKDGFIYLDRTKTDESREIPINDDLAEVLRDVRKRNQLRSEYVFCNSKGNPYKDVTTAFEASLKRAAIKDFRFHDLRHTFASHFVMRGGPLRDLQEILGHKTLTMTMRYAHLSEEHKKKAINLLSGLTTPSSVTNLSHFKKASE